MDEETYIDMMLNHECKKCGSRNYNYVHDFMPEAVPSIRSYFQCRDCGHIEYV